MEIKKGWNTVCGLLVNSEELDLKSFLYVINDFTEYTKDELTKLYNNFWASDPFARLELAKNDNFKRWLIADEGEPYDNVEFCAQTERVMLPGTECYHSLIEDAYFIDRESMIQYHLDQGYTIDEIEDYNGGKKEYDPVTEDYVPVLDIYFTSVSY